MFNSLQEILLGIVIFIVFVKLGIYLFINVIIDMDFGNGGQIKMNIFFNGVWVINIFFSFYIIFGIIKVNMSMRNDISLVNFIYWVDV